MATVNSLGVCFGNILMKYSIWENVWQEVIAQGKASTIGTDANTILKLNS